MRKNRMEYIGKEWWVEYEFVNGLAMRRKTFGDKEEAEEFAKKVNSKALETRCYKC